MSKMFVLAVDDISKEYTHVYCDYAIGFSFYVWPKYSEVYRCGYSSSELISEDMEK